VVLDVGLRRRPPRAGMPGLQRPRAPSGADLPGVPQPGMGTARRVGAGHRRRVHGEPPPVAAGPGAAVRDRQRGPRGGPDRPADDQHHRVRARRGARRAAGSGALRIARGRVSPPVRTRRRHRRARPGR
jgi:hypothetical protein